MKADTAGSGAEIEREQPVIDAEIRAKLAEQREWAAVFVELKEARPSLGLSLDDIEASTPSARPMAHSDIPANGQHHKSSPKMPRGVAQIIGRGRSREG